MVAGRVDVLANDKSVSTVQLYHIKTYTWTTAAPMQRAREIAGAVTMSNGNEAVVC